MFIVHYSSSNHPQKDLSLLKKPDELLVEFEEEPAELVVPRSAEVVDLLTTVSALVVLAAWTGELPTRATMAMTSQV